MQGRIGLEWNCSHLSLPCWSSLSRSQLSSLGSCNTLRNLHLLALSFHREVATHLLSSSLLSNGPPWSLTFRFWATIGRLHILIFPASSAFARLVFYQQSVLAALRTLFIPLDVDGAPFVAGFHSRGVLLGASIEDYLLRDRK